MCSMCAPVNVYFACVCLSVCAYVQAAMHVCVCVCVCVHVLCMCVCACACVDVCLSINSTCMHAVDSEADLYCSVV